jgi:hypothetical protein
VESVHRHSSAGRLNVEVRVEHCLPSTLRCVPEGGTPDCRARACGREVKSLRAAAGTISIEVLAKHCTHAAPAEPHAKRRPAQHKDAKEAHMQVKQAALARR